MAMTNFNDLLLKPIDELKTKKNTRKFTHYQKTESQMIRPWTTHYMTKHSKKHNNHHNRKLRKRRIITNLVSSSKH